jgi:hypothetical protein
LEAGVAPENCGEGFESDGRRGCDAILPSRSCPKGMLAIMGETACRAVSPCAPGKWGDVPVDSTTQYVDGGAGGSETGSATEPWSSIQEGVDAALPGALVAVAAGAYAEDVLIEGKAVRLWGACPEQVTLTGSATLSGVLDVRPGAAGTEIRALSVEGGWVGVAIDGVEDILVDRVWIHDTQNLGLMAQDLPDVTSAMVRGSLVEATTTIGVFAYGSTLSIEESVVRDVQSASDGQWGRAVSVWVDPASMRRGTLDMHRTLVERNPEYGIYCVGCDATVEESLVRDTRPRASDGLVGYGVFAVANYETAQRATLSLRRSNHRRARSTAGVLPSSPPRCPRERPSRSRRSSAVT